MPKTFDQEMVYEFKRRFNRDPTSEDIDGTSRRVITQLEQKRLRGEDERDQRLSFDAMAEGIKGIGFPVVANDVYAAMDDLLREERKTLVEKKQRNEKRKKRQAVYIKGLIAASLLGAVGGTGFGAYYARHDPEVKQKILEYESRKAELEERFFGTLPSLEEITQTTLTPKERDLTLKLYLGLQISSQLLNQTNIFYQTSLGSISLEARRVFTKDSRGYEEDKLLLIKRGADDRSIFSSHLYDEECTGVCDNISDLVENNSPL